MIFGIAKITIILIRGERRQNTQGMGGWVTMKLRKVKHAHERIYSDSRPGNGITLEGLVSLIRFLALNLRK